MYIFQPDRFLLDKQVKKFSRYVTGRVLDIGAGQVDRYSRYFSYDEYVRMDVEPRQGVDMLGSADAIPVSDESFDSIVCTQVFEHLERPQQAAREMARVLKPGGYAVVTVPQMNELHEEPHDFFRYTNFGLITLFTTAGFEVIGLDQRGGFFATVAQMKIRYLIDRFLLYQRPLLGKVLALYCSLYGKFGLFLDSIDKSAANRKHAIGWCVILKKHE